MPTHLTESDRAALLAIADRCSLPELLRTVAAIVGNDVEDIEQAADCRSRINRVALELDGKA